MNPRHAYRCAHCGRAFVVPSLARHHERTCPMASEASDDADEAP